MTDPEFTLKRVDDTGGHWGAARAWWRLNAAFVVGPWLMAVSGVLILVAIVVWSDQRATKKASQVSCERSREFGPAIADDYERRGVLPKSQLDKYRRTIPKNCPK